MTDTEVTPDEFRRIRQACHELGADEELTALVLASHRYNRALLDVMVADGNDLMGYVRYKLKVWEAILTDSLDEPCQDDHQAAATLPNSGAADH